MPTTPHGRQKGRRQSHLAILGSAAGAIASSRKYHEPADPALRASFQELQTSLRNNAIPGGPLIAPEKLMTATEVETVNGPFLKAWITTGPGADRRVELLSDFLAHAGVGQWLSYPEHRTNTSRFRLLHNYYTQVLPFS